MLQKMGSYYIQNLCRMMTKFLPEFQELLIVQVTVCIQTIITNTILMMIYTIQTMYKIYLYTMQMTQSSLITIFHFTHSEWHVLVHKTFHSAVIVIPNSINSTQKRWMIWSFMLIGFATTVYFWSVQMMSLYGLLF